MDKFKAILLDIEGTTTPISFVHEILFPLVKDNLKEYILSNWNEPSLQRIVSSLRVQSQEHVKAGKYTEEIKTEDSGNTGDEVQESTINYIHFQMANDLKTNVLKELQGQILQIPFKDGRIKGDVYADVEPAMKRWTEEGKKIYIYSSGSIHAQKLVFGYSKAGDLTRYISNYFDTSSGPKQESSSYTNIAQSIGLPPQEILFLTDVPREAYAAREAKMNAFLMLRPGNKPLNEKEYEDFPTFQTFDINLP